MRRKIKPIDPSELFDADDIDKTTIKGEMRKLYPAIHQKLSLSVGKWSARDMVKWFDERGVSMSVELFRVYLNELDHEQGYSRSKKKFHVANEKISTQSVPMKEKEEVMPVSRSSGKRKSILNADKGMFGELNPPAADGVVDFKQK